MRTKTRSLAFCLTACLLACVTGHAHEQDNWYLAWEADLNYSVINYYGPYQVFLDENKTSGKSTIYSTLQRADKIIIFDANGSKTGEITNLPRARGVAVDDNGVIYCLYRNGLKSFNPDGSLKQIIGTSGSGDGQFKLSDATASFYSHGALALHPNNGRLYAVDGDNNRIQVFDTNGSFYEKFGSAGTAPGKLDLPKFIAFTPDARLIITDRNHINYFDENGTFIKRVSGGNLTVAVDKYSHKMWTSDGKIRSIEGNILANSVNGIAAVFNSMGDLIISQSINEKSVLQLWKNAYRTKGLPQRNVIPQPAIRKISQRSGTNILDLDFEIIDSDDTNATVGILAYAENVRVVPQAWTDGTGSKIGTPIATNQVHRVSWDVKQDWADNTGTIKFEILCQDGRTNKPVDIHFLTLPLADGNLTISRSPIKDSDFGNYFKFLLATGSNEVAYENGNITNGSGSTYFNTNNQYQNPGKIFFMNKLGYRWATATEVANAKAAATIGTTNTWAASNPVQPRNLPQKVNEYGFDTGNHGNRALWVVKE